VKRVLVLRAREDAERTAERLQAMGYAPLVSPALQVVATGAAAPAGEFDAAIATSAKAVEHCVFALGLPLHVVGARAYALAGSRGFERGLVASDASLLASSLCAKYLAPARFLYLAGHDRKDALETRLRDAGHRLVAVEIYEARAAETLTSEAVAAFTRGDVAAALHYSRRSAEVFARLAQDAGLTEAARRPTHVALSRDVAAQLRRDFGVTAHVADAPNEERLLALLAAQVAP